MVPCVPGSDTGVGSRHREATACRFRSLQTARSLVAPQAEARHHVVVAGAYFMAILVLQWVASLFNVASSLSLWYLPSGLTFAFLAICGWRWAPWALVASVAGNVLTSSYAPNVLAAVPGILAYAGGAAVLNTVRRNRQGLALPQDLATLTLVVAASSAAAALGDVSVLYLTGTFMGPPMVAPCVDWWIGDLVGIITLGPVLLLGLERVHHAVRDNAVLARFQGWFQRYGLELRLIVLVVAVTVLGVYTIESTTGLRVAFLYFLPLLWLSLRPTFLLSALGTFLMNAGIIVTLAHLNLSPSQQRDNQLLIATLSLVSLLVSILEAQRRTQQAALQYQVEHDTLTGLTSRVAFQPAVDALVRAAHPGERLLLLFIDIDRLKHINDAHGHLAGDAYLKSVAGQLRHSTTTVPDLQAVVARLSGDEFAVAARVKGQDDALIRGVLDGLHRTVRIAGHDLQMAFSIGVSVAALRPSDGHTVLDSLDLATLIQQADEAMYHAKQSGRSLQWFEPPPESGLTALECEQGLRRALETEGELVLHYQPLIDLQTREVLGCEALVRWQHPTRGLLGPAAFLPVAERTGLIIPLGRWVLRTACLQAGLWRRQHQRPLRISVNVDAQQFRTDTFVREVLDAIQVGEIAASQLDLELTESAILLDATTAIEHLEILQQHGVRLALDDFGMGYSSLSHLRDFHVHVLKIDRSFTRNLLSNGRDLRIVQAMVALGHSLGTRVLIEGIETVEQLEMAATLGCDEVQGYLLGRPVPPAQLELSGRTQDS
ncbi:bifunctional diguanylate cyclase/phosphodiesterase [Deinococcus sp. KSM4-11]|uniref:putative bifunctional diguanylate cyclase/phosphodiesterase n=1 Tax=Deinococcus sp. KSM4-11 TaxID=2568654 RepID=UPI0021043FD7|nr:EAL domain-containing protein [Deinococcus sp. KSM4-11]